MTFPFGFAQDMSDMFSLGYPFQASSQSFKTHVLGVDLGCNKLLQIVSRPDTEQRANEDTGPRRGWIVKSHIGWREE